VGIIFAQIFVADFRENCTVWGIIGGIYIQAIKIPDRAHKTPPDGIRGGKTAGRATATKAGHARSDNGAGHRHRLPGRPAALPRQGCTRSAAGKPGPADHVRPAQASSAHATASRGKPSHKIGNRAQAIPPDRRPAGRQTKRPRPHDSRPLPASHHRRPTKRPHPRYQTPAPALAHTRAKF